VTIGYGTGQIKGEFVRDKVCPGASDQELATPCIEVNIVTAVEMSNKPFRSFNFDGIFGLSLDSLAMTPDFSFLTRLAGSSVTASQQFGVFLTDGLHGEQSEIALGGHNEKKLLTPLKWVPVTRQQMGYWQVSIKEVRVAGKALPSCQDGSCSAIMDTGTSHIGVPGGDFRELVDLLSIDMRHPTLDCRQAEGPHLEFVMDAEITLRLSPVDYMRPLSLAAGTNVGLSNGVPVIVGRNVTASDNSSAVAKKFEASADGQVSELHSCTPRMMPVNLPQPLGPKLFILGEPALQKYYTVSDVAQRQIGFGLSASSENRKAFAGATGDEIFLVQVKLELDVRVRAPRC
jgi:hypothetical protein